MPITKCHNPMWNNVSQWEKKIKNAAKDKEQKTCAAVNQTVSTGKKVVYTCSCVSDEISRPLINSTWSPSLRRGIHRSAGVLEATFETITGRPWSAPPCTDSHTTAVFYIINCVLVQLIYWPARWPLNRQCKIPQTFRSIPTHATFNHPGWPL